MSENNLRVYYKNQLSNNYDRLFDLITIYKQKVLVSFAIEIQFKSTTLFNESYLSLNENRFKFYPLLNVSITDLKLNKEDYILELENMVILNGKFIKEIFKEFCTRSQLLFIDIILDSELNKNV